jgi:signal transduction histidine kinase
MNTMFHEALPRLLVVDDDPQAIRMLARMLEGIGQVQMAVDGNEALTRVSEARPDLVLLDAEMPGLDGFATCAALHGLPGCEELPIVFVTARVDPESESRALSLGAVDFIHKPLSPPVVQARVRTHLALQRRNAQVREANRELEARVAERTADLRLALSQAQAADRAKSAFLANMSHEIRTPMNAILGMADIIEFGGLTKKQAKHLAMQKRSGQRLLQMLCDILDFSSLERGECGLILEPLDVATLVGEAVALVKERLAAKGLQLLVDLKPLPHGLLGDPARLRQALLNYLNNAVKFTERGTISVRVRLEESSEGCAQVRFEVQDTGIGIAPEARARLFFPFEQSDNSITRPYEGAGLGLAITQQLARLMGGLAGVESSPSVGSTFWFSARLDRAIPIT